jgi:predicted metal-binding membrane protein
MNGMDMGVATTLGSFAVFVVLWMWMMAAMMLPGAVPAVVRRARASGGAGALPLLVASYLAIWTLVGLAVYPLYRPHETLVAGAIVIAAGGYELTPLKRHFHRRCRENVRSGVTVGLCCVGSSIGLMLTLVALGVMSVSWMSADRRPRRGPEAAAAEGCRRSAGGTGDHRVWRPDRHRILDDSRTYALDVRRRR